MTIRPAHWIALGLLVMLWGSSYLLIEVALWQWRPAQLTGLRVLLATLVLLVALLVTRGHFPRDRRSWGFCLLIAVVGNCLPFFLISWGQQHVESGLAGILSASTPLMVLVLAHYVLPDEPLRRRHLLPFLLCFAGIVVLLGPDSLAALAGSGDRLLAQLAILAAALCYAAATIIARRMPPLSPLVTAGSVMLLASVVMSPFIVNGTLRLERASATVILTVGFLGLFGTGFAAILFFYLVRETGARFTSLLNYLVPVWAVILGSVILREKLSLSTWFALILILSGLIFISRFDDIAPRFRGSRPQN